jgi:hypothetical protein
MADLQTHDLVRPKESRRIAERLPGGVESNQRPRPRNERLGPVGGQRTYQNGRLFDSRGCCQVQPAPWPLMVGACHLAGDKS